jgi:uncharacterized protein (DUF433 family)
MERITFNAHVMCGKPCIRGMRITVGVILGLLAKGYLTTDILKLYPYLEAKDIEAALLTINKQRTKIRILPIKKRNNH